jgi:hypothetical protein
MQTHISNVSFSVDVLSLLQVFLRAGESALVSFEVTLHDLTLVSDGGGRHAVAGVWTLRVGSEATVDLVVA